jgi:hypothetical protein
MALGNNACPCQILTPIVYSKCLEGTTVFNYKTTMKSEKGINEKNLCQEIRGVLKRYILVPSSVLLDRLYGGPNKKVANNLGRFVYMSMTFYY